MSRFGWARAATKAIPQRTFTFYGLAKPGLPNIEFDVRPATEANPAYWDQRAKAEASEPAFRAAARGDVTTATAAASRRIDLDLFPETVVTGWRNVCDDAGNPVEFTVESCRELLGDIQSHNEAGVVVGGGRFDELREYCKVPSNFTGGLDVSAVAKH